MKNKIAIISIFILIGSILIYISIKTDVSKIEELKIEYPKIDFYSKIDETIQSKYYSPNFRRSPNYLRLVFTSGSKYTVSVTGNSINSDVSIEQISMKGASLIKKKYSDTLEINYKGKSHKFILNTDTL